MSYPGASFSNQGKYDKEEEDRIRREKEEAQRQKHYTKEEEEQIKKELDKKSREE